jgi:hypothetical protein
MPLVNVMLPARRLLLATKQMLPLAFIAIMSEYRVCDIRGIDEWSMF